MEGIELTICTRAPDERERKGKLRMEGRRESEREEGNKGASGPRARDEGREGDGKEGGREGRVRKGGRETDKETLGQSISARPPGLLYTVDI